MKDWIDWMVIESRHNESEKLIRRRRKSNSGERITTIEITKNSYKRLLDVSKKYRNLKRLIKLVVNEGVNE